MWMTYWLVGRSLEWYTGPLSVQVEQLTSKEDKDKNLMADNKEAIGKVDKEETLEEDVEKIDRIYEEELSKFEEEGNSRWQKWNY